MKILNFNELLVVAIIFILPSCNSNDKAVTDYGDRISSYPFTINLEEALANPISLNLSDIADSIRYVMLSDEDIIPIRAIQDIEIIGNDIFIHASCEHPIFLRFNISGEFQNIIGAYGRGPGEYLSGSHFSVDKDNERILILRWGSNDYLAYGYTGEFIRKINIVPNKSNSDFTIIEGDKLLKFYSYSEVPGRGVFPEKMLLCSLTDLNDTIINEVSHPAINKNGFIIDRPILIRTALVTYYNNSALINNWGLDTIFKATNDSIYPAFIMNFGEFTPNYIQRYSYVDKDESLNFFNWYGKKTIETETDVFASYGLNDKAYLFRYNKQSGDLVSMKFNSADLILGYMPSFPDLGFINDIDNGMNFYPDWTNREGNIWIDQIDAVKFINEHSQKAISDSNLTSKSNINQILKKVKGTDNPILRLVYLKN